MKKLLVLFTLSALFLSNCSSLGAFFPTSTPIPTSTITFTPTITLTPTITVTPSPTFTPTPTQTPMELDANGLPIFPEGSISHGDGIEIAFSQGVLNELQVQGIQIPEETATNIRQMLFGQWLYIRGAPGYGHLNPKDLNDLKNANAKNDGIGIQVETQYFNIKPVTTLRIDFVRGCREEQRSEFEKMQAFFSQQTEGHVLSRIDSRWGSSDLGRSKRPMGSISAITYFDSYSIRFVNYVDCLGLSKYPPRPYLAVAEMFRSFTILSYSTIMGNYLGRIPSMGLEQRMFAKESKLIGLSVLGGCQVAGEECEDGTEKWNFSVIR